MKVSSRAVALIVALSTFSANAYTIATPPPPQNIAVSAPSLVLGTRASSLSYHQELALLSTSTWLSDAAVVTAQTPTKGNVVTTPLQSTEASISITNLQFDGKVPTTESDEYVVITNRSKSPMNVAGYYLYVASNGTQGATFTFPANAVIAPSASVRVYTNEIHKETGGYSFNSKKAIWNNKGGLAVLKDASGRKLGEYKYKP
ncbi:hypothetical protein FisN_6Lh404 [Fistulifera solaris]|uniref:LTD domain-containing protein n=1 Tax=Fistulifera solaris TaxID=1519565 RepID=A0A1Z5JLH5_FISSO|nr:hypothetical protein FisN_6Lh404 [Fistulifera solaris]|eukprot:GAX14621.1 hypothetical protein FisN_6Lh404 [Fistulifera solaris]